MKPSVAAIVLQYDKNWKGVIKGHYKERGALYLYDIINSDFDLEKFPDKEYFKHEITVCTRKQIIDYCHKTIEQGGSEKWKRDMFTGIISVLAAVVGAILTYILSPNQPKPTTTYVVIPKIYKVYDTIIARDTIYVKKPKK